MKKKECLFFKIDSDDVAYFYYFIISKGNKEAVHFDENIYEKCNEIISKAIGQSSAKFDYQTYGELLIDNITTHTSSEICGFAVPVEFFLSYGEDVPMFELSMFLDTYLNSK
ncbi:hypothetical protein CGK66_11110 [Vibrio parahaemolyticus]|uniref:hypothetical protein n=1 Tax=Vibrio parahaemolyticus TaxID=670 RepID=UPI0001BC6D12|nr:hypothetical protein [Vibrio parahaemolyticus]TNY57864.1 hypothetical protein CGK66_11110 [Vibrio parahaemolyticus]